MIGDGKNSCGVQRPKCPYLFGNISIRLSKNSKIDKAPVPIFMNSESVVSWVLSSAMLWASIKNVMKIEHASNAQMVATEVA